MAMAHSKKNACKLIDEAKFRRIEHHKCAFSVDVTKECSRWWDLSFSPFSFIELGTLKATYLNGFAYMWCNHNNSYIRLKLRISNDGKIKPDWRYCGTIGDFSEDQLTNYKKQDREMRGMLNVI